MKDASMKHVLRFLIRLYPAWWRQRYGRELEALLEDSGSRSRDMWDLFRAAMEVQMKTWSFARIVALCGIAGLVLAGAIAFSMPYRYRSTATLRVEPDSKALESLTQAALTRNVLTSIVNNFNLYPRERKRMPMQDVIDDMRQAIRVRSVAPNLAQVSFAYEDPVQAQRVSQDLVARIIFANMNVQLPSGQIELVAPADQAQRQIEGKVRTAMTSLGLPAGLLFGVALTLLLRRRAPIR